MNTSVVLELYEVLGELREPYLQQTFAQARLIQDIQVKLSHIHVRLCFTYPVGRQLQAIKETIEQCVASKWPGYIVDVEVQWNVQRHAVQKGVKPLAGIKNIIAVASGKGGVGKSTVALHLALALQGLGAKVALLDADIYGPSQPRLLGKQGTQAVTQDKKFLPVESFGVQSISMGYLFSDEQTPAVWRGPMASGALLQLLNETQWQACDYLIIDLPPGTGDIQLTMAQKIPISAAVIVTSPQEVALLDAKKAYRMFDKLAIPVLGIIENMSWHHCSQCGHQEAIFGLGGGKRMAQEFQLPLLAQLPLSREICERSDKGEPILVFAAHHPLALPYWEMAQRVCAGLAKQPVDYSGVMPKIVIQ